MGRARVRSHATLLAATLFLLTSQVWAQAGLATFITGIVTDRAGAAIPGAKVTITSEEMGINVELVTTEKGFYRSANLLPGPYVVKASATGFRPTIRTGLTLQLGRALAVDFQLERGSVAQSVRVTHVGPLLDTQTAEVGQVVGDKMVAALPLIYGRVGSLLVFTPAVDYMGQNVGAFGTPDYQVAGSGRAEYMVGDADVSSDRTGWNGMFFSPPSGAVQEVSVITSGYPAEYGGTEGSVITMQLKSGTNALHGSLYYDGRNTNLDARNPFFPSRAGDHFNVFGADVGGPIKRNRTFFFVTTEWIRNLLPEYNPVTVPTLAMRKGDFSGLKDVNGNMVPIYDPATTRPDPAHPGQFIRDSFPGNIIRPELIDPAAANIVSFFPAPNQVGTISGANNYGGSWDREHVGWTLTAKVDHRISDRDQLSFQELAAKLNETLHLLPGWPAASQGDPSAWFGFLTWNSSNFLSGSETHAFSPSLSNQAKFTWQRKHWENKCSCYQPDAQWPAQLGLKNVYGQEGFPRVTSTGYIGLGAIYLQELQMTPISVYNWADTLTWIKGSHSFKFGVDTILAKVKSGMNEYPGGLYNFDVRETALPGASGTGNAIASLLLGQVDTGSMFQSFKVRRSGTTYYALFAQDDWRISSRFTINYGLRWELDTPPGDSNNYGSGFDPAAINPVSGTPGVLTFMGISMPNKFWGTDYHRFQPRFGFAYRATKNTVVRGGYGIYSAFNYAGANGEFTPAFGFYPVNDSWSTPDNGITPAWILQNGMPSWHASSAAYRTPGFGAVPVGQYPGLSPWFLAYHHPWGYAEHFNLSIEHELPGGTLLEVGSEGSLGRKLQVIQPWNQVPPNMALPGNAQARRPFPQFGDVMQNNAMTGTTDYWALTVRAEKTYSHGLSLIGNYAWSRNLGIMACDDVYNCRLSRGPVPGPTGIDAASATPSHHSRIGVVYELPMGKGKAIAKSGAAERLLGDWKVAFVTYFRSGYPFSLTGVADSQNRFSTIGYRLNLVGNLKLAHPTLQQWFNTAAVAPPAFGQIGDLGPGVLTGPGMFDLDMSLHKEIACTDRLRLQLGAEAFDALNHPTFGLPGTIYGTPNFGIITGSATGSQLGGSTSSRIIQIGAQLIF